jgi:RNA polymerase sigma-70 factor (ECF subfamily)
MRDGANSKSSNLSTANHESSWEGLLARVAEHDVAALEELYDALAPRLMGLLARMLPVRREAEETLREVFLRLWREADRLVQIPGSVVVWLVLMARHAALERLRARRAATPQATQNPERAARAKPEEPPPRRPAAAARRPKKLISSEPETSRFPVVSPESWMPAPADIALVEARLELLLRAIDQMPKPQRRALELAVFDGYSEAEIAARVGEPLGKVNAGLRAAFTFLRHRQRAVLGTWTADI